MRPIVQSIFDRHVAAMRSVSAGGTWIDDTAARLSLCLALQELDAHHMSVNPAANGRLEQMQQGELRMLHWLDVNATLASTEDYSADPVGTILQILDERGRVIADQESTLVSQADKIGAMNAELAELRRMLNDGKLAYVNGGQSDRPAIDWSGLPEDLQAQIARLEHEETGFSWRQVPNTDRKAITLYMLPRLGDTTMSMSEFGKRKPDWMPAGQALAITFGLRWVELLEQAHRVAVL